MREGRSRFPPFFLVFPAPPPIRFPTTVIRAESADLDWSLQKHLIKLHHALSIAKASESHYGLAEGGRLTSDTGSRECATRRNGHRNSGRREREAAREQGGDVGDRRRRITED